MVYQLAISDRGNQNRFKNRIELKYSYNDSIVSPLLRVISEDGVQMGIMNRDEAIEYAKSKNLDLIEIASNVEPPVARVQSWSKFKFEQSKKEKAAKKKNKSKEIKEMWFQPLIGQNDKDHKIKRIREFLEEKHGVKLVIKMQGRVSPERGFALMQDILTSLADVSSVDGEVRREGRQIHAMIRPSKNKQ